MTDVHSCSYYCDRPECIKAQRDELRERLATMTDRKLMQQAFEAMLNFPDDISDEMFESIKALRKRLAQPEQKPVAWMHNDIEGNVITHRPADLDRHPERWTPLYTAPPQRKPLTEKNT